MDISLVRLQVLLFLALNTLLGFAQGSALLKDTELALKRSFTSVISEQEDQDRIQQSLEFQSDLARALKLKGSWSYPWDSLKNMARLESPDRNFRIYNWNVPLSGGRNRYFCLIQFKDKLKNDSLLVLTDHSDSVKDQEHFTGKAGSWFGALYYKIIPFEMKGGAKAYLLLGWAGINTGISSKLIEVLTFDNKNQACFGGSVFPDFRDGKQTRVIFRYSSNSGMSLKYLLQKIPGKAKWNAKKREFEQPGRTMPMIVCDHLIPLDPKLENQFQFYVPSSEVADGFIFEDNSWKFIPEFEALNSDSH
jgi:hypothetical protein